jgi:hypothetical protein
MQTPKSTSELKALIAEVELCTNLEALKELDASLPEWGPGMTLLRPVLARRVHTLLYTWSKEEDEDFSRRIAIGLAVPLEWLSSPKKPL